MIEIAINSALALPVKINPQKQFNGDLKVSLRKYLLENIIFQLTYQYIHL